MLQGYHEAPIGRGSEAEDDDLERGPIYVLRSMSDHPDIAPHRELIHKIGVTGGKVETRIANAALNATYLPTDVEIVATYKLFTSTGRGWKTSCTASLDWRALT